MWQRRAGLLALLPGLWLASAHALGLGDIDLRSRLNQRLVANVPVLGAEPSEVESLVVRLASPEDFARAGIERPEFLSSLEFTLAPSGDSVRVSSRQTVRDPLLNFIVEARWNGGRVLREYTVLLDPPLDAARDAPPAPVPVPAAVPARSAAAASGAAASHGRYGPVLPSETLWSIATKLRPSPAITMDQVLLAIYRGNPQAFEGGINGLLKGATLSVPSAEDMSRVDAVGAHAEVSALRAQPVRVEAATKAKTTASIAAAAGKPLPSPPTAEVAKPAPAPAPAPPVPAAPDAAAPPPAPTTEAAATAPHQPSLAAAPAEATASAPAATNPAAAAPAAASAEASTETPAPTSAPAADATEHAEAGKAEAAPETAPTATPSVEPAAVVETPTPAAAAPADTDLDALLPSGLQAPLLAAALALLGGLVLLRRRRAAHAAAAAAAAQEPPRAPAAAIDVLLADSKPAIEPAPARTEPTLEVPSMPTPVTEPLPVVAAEPPPPEPVAEPSPPPALQAAPAIAEPVARSSLPPPVEEAQVIEAAPLPPPSEASDPLTEADFHIAYGLYDEAAQMLREAAEAEPARVELRSKLADTYFAAGKAEAFLDTAAGLRGQVSRGEWQRITDMGRSLCPDAALFADPATAAPEPAAAFRPDPEPAPVIPAERLEDIRLIDFDLDAELAGGQTATMPAAPAWDPAAPLSGTPATPSDTAMFAPPSGTATLPDPPANLAQGFEASAGAPVFDLSVSEPASQPVLADREPEPVPHAPLDLLASVEQPMPPEPLRVADLPPPAFDDHLTAAAFDIDAQLPADSADADAAFAIGDEADTKLDLARAYADMGDEDAARSLLAEVIASGNEHQRREAESLSQRLGG